MVACLLGRCPGTGLFLQELDRLLQQVERLRVHRMGLQVLSSGTTWSGSASGAVEGGRLTHRRRQDQRVELVLEILDRLLGLLFGPGCRGLVFLRTTTRVSEYDKRLQCGWAGRLPLQLWRRPPPAQPLP